MTPWWDDTTAYMTDRLGPGTLLVHCGCGCVYELDHRGVRPEHNWTSPDVRPSRRCPGSGTIPGDGALWVWKPSADRA